MTIQDVLRQRLSNQHLSGKKFQNPAEVVSWLGAVQSQDFSGGKWAVGQRLEAGSDASVEQAFNEGKILRTHVMRPTWHFVTPEDIRWMQQLTSPRVKAISAYYFRMQNLDEVVFAKSHKIITKALQGKKQLTRNELSQTLKQGGINREGLGLTYVVIQAELDGLICSGPRLGKQFSYMLLEERVPKAKPKTMEEALAELTKRYFTSHGPALMEDFVWWSGLMVRDVKKGLAMNKSVLSNEVIDGKEYWFADSNPVVPIPSTIQLLPNYDEYTIAYKDRSAFFIEDNIKNLAARENSSFVHMIVMQGRIIGTWRRIFTKDTVSIETLFFIKLTEAENKAFTMVAKEYGDFLHLKVKLVPAT